MKKLLFWLTDRLPMRVINDGERPYLERYYLFTILGWRFYIHQFVGSDPERSIHDHPWRRAFSIILSGSYVEELRSGIREVNWFNSLTGDTFHRVILQRDKSGIERPCWTLFFHSKDNVKQWGFLFPLRHGMPNGEMIFKPYEYSREGSQIYWWLTAKSRKQLREGK